MEHIGLIFTVLAFGLGMVALSHAAQLFRRYLIPYLKSHAILLGLINGAVFFGLVYNYLQFNLMKELVGSGEIFLYSIYHFILALLAVATLYYLLRMIFHLLKKEWTRKGQTFFFGSFGVLIIAQIVSAFSNFRIGVIPVYMYIALITVLSFYIIGCVSVGVLYFQAQSLSLPKQKKKLQSLALFILCVFIAALVLNTLNIIDVIPLNAGYLVLMPLLIILINLVSLSGLKDFLKELFPQETSPAGDNARMDSLFNKYKIAPREQEIIKLICNGKINREIEQLLFISSHTVKEYIYRIYKKTGVKNRVQLTNLFRNL